MSRTKGTEVKLDLDQLEKLAAIGATQHEVAYFLGVSPATIEARLKREDFRAAWDRGQANLKLSLRRQQVLQADKGNITMLIWLGKQLLGQRDNLDTKLTGNGPNGELEVNGSSATELLTSRITRIAARARAQADPGDADGSASPSD